MLMVFKLTGDFDVKEAIKHGNADAELSENFKRLNASIDNFKGFPSSMIEGSYDLNGARMHSYNRIVIATGAPPANQRYLVQFTVTGTRRRPPRRRPTSRRSSRASTSRCRSRRQSSATAKPAKTGETVVTSATPVPRTLGIMRVRLRYHIRYQAFGCMFTPHTVLEWLL